MWQAFKRQCSSYIVEYRLAAMGCYKPETTKSVSIGVELHNWCCCTTLHVWHSRSFAKNSRSLCVDPTWHPWAHQCMPTPSLTKLKYDMINNKVTQLHKRHDYKCFALRWAAKYKSNIPWCQRCDIAVCWRRCRRLACPFQRLLFCNNPCINNIVHTTFLILSQNFPRSLS